MLGHETTTQKSTRIYELHTKAQPQKTLNILALAMVMSETTSWEAM